MEHRTNFLTMEGELERMMLWLMVAMNYAAATVATGRGTCTMGIGRNSPRSVDMMYLPEAVDPLGLMYAAGAKGHMSIGNGAAPGSMPVTWIEGPLNRGCSPMAPPNRGRPSFPLSLAVALAARSPI